MWVSPVSRSHSSETVKLKSCRVSSSTNMLGSFVAPLSHSRAAGSGDLTTQACAPSIGIAHVSTRGSAPGMHHWSAPGPQLGAQDRSSPGAAELQAGAAPRVVAPLEADPWTNPVAHPGTLTGATRSRTAQGRPVTPPVPHEEDHMAVMTDRSAGDTTIR